ncbi:MAG: RHS repeat-associated core domain-containing protein [Actinobacteria bacterium]|nr:RHS repeat-associated core domain-containing protein [Actinomycetota bacterium]
MTPPNTTGVTCANPSVGTSYGYTYNANGLRMSQTSPGGTTEQFTWNTLSSVPQLLMDGSNAYIYGPQGTALGTAPVEQISLSAPNSQSSVTYLVSDPQGVRLTFNSTSTITAGASYDAYGNVIAGGLSSITPFGYAGGYTDPTGLIYLVNRYYDPSTGQFLSVDPLVSITDQPYQYVGGDPINGSDPSGLSTHAFCISLQGIFQPVGMGGAALFVEGCLGEAEHGQIGTFVTYGAGPSIGPGHSVSGNIVEEVTNASSLKQLGGWFNWLNVGGGDGLGATAGSFWGCSGQQKITGGTFGVGLSIPGVSFQGGKSNTVDIHIYGGAAAVALKTLYYSLYFSSPGLTVSASVIQKITQLFVE